VLDHVVDPQGVLSEIGRVLRSGGLVYIAVDVYDSEEAERRERQEREGIIVDECHPHTFTHDSLRKLIVRSGFKILNRFDAPSGKGDESIRFCIFGVKQTIL
jgi:SAM-dependent methyltransferase